jgi:hypothetical protein
MTTASRNNSDLNRSSPAAVGLNITRVNFNSQRRVMIFKYRTLRMKISIPIIFALLFCFSASATEVHATCNLVHRFSGLHVSTMMHMAGSQISAKEKSYLHSRYSKLKAECASNPQASQLVTISPELKNLLSAHGVRIKNKKLAFSKKRKGHPRKVA